MLFFWLAIIGAVIFAWLGVRMGFYMAWQSLFNSLIALYVGVMLTPRLVGLVPDIGASGYHAAACVTGIAVLVFILLETVTACFLTGISDVVFPRIFQTIGAAALGFVLGYVVVSFVLFIIYVMPFSRASFMRYVFPPGQQPVCVAAVTHACGFVDSISLQYRKDAIADVVDWLTAEPQPDAARPRRAVPGQRNDPKWIEGPERPPR